MAPKRLISHSPLFVDKLAHIFVYPIPGFRDRARIVAGNLILPCSIGRSGVVRVKREGDQGTPAARLRLTEILFRPDRDAARLPAPAGLPRSALHRNDSWNEDPRSGRYNRRLRLNSLAEPDRTVDKLWRTDRLYDVIGVFNWNVRPRASYRGSAIFLHYQRPDGGPTAGCLALAPRHMRLLLPWLTAGTIFHVAPVPRRLGHRR